MPDSNVYYDEIKISELPAADQANAADQLETNQDGTTRRITIDQVRNAHGTTGTGKTVLQTSPELLGEPTAPTPLPGDNDQSIATTEWVNEAIAGIVGGAIPSGPAGGALSGTYPNPGLAVPYPTTLPPSGPAGGDLEGDYPNPTIKPSALPSAVNVLNYVPQNLWAAIADGTSTTNIVTYLQTAIDSGADELYFPAGKYRLAGSVWLLHRGNQHWRGAGIGRTIIEKAGYYGIVRAHGTINTTQGNTLASPAAAGDTAITLSSGKVGNFAIGDIALLMDETPIIATATDPADSKHGEFVTITNIAGNVLTLLSPIQYSYSTVAVTGAAQLQKITWLRGVQISDMSFTNTVQIEGNAPFVYSALCMEPKITNCSAYYGISSGFTFTGCYDARATVEVSDLLSNSGAGYFGYGVLEAGPNVGGQFNITAARVRHAYTTGGGLVMSGPNVQLVHGVPTSTKITGVATDTYAAAWDTHPVGYGIIFNDCITNGSMHAAYQIRSNFTQIIGGHASKTTGPGIYLPNSVDTIATDTFVNGVVMDRTNCGVSSHDTLNWRELGAIEDQGTRSTVINCSINNAGGSGINMTGEALDCIYRGIRILNPCRSSTTIKDGISILGSGVRRVRIDNVDIGCGDTKMNYGIRITSADVVPLITGAFVAGAQVESIQTLAAHKSWANPANVPVSFGPSGSVRIAGGVLDVTGQGTGLINVLPEQSGGVDANDDLVTITAPADTTTLLIRNGSARVITIKPSPPAAGNIITPTGADMALTTTSIRMLTKFGASWLMTTGT